VTGGSAKSAAGTPSAAAGSSPATPTGSSKSGKPVPKELAAVSGRGLLFWLVCHCIVGNQLGSSQTGPL
jgi:hypothetical protein